jgi:hypothetical protein
MVDMHHKAQLLLVEIRSPYLLGLTSNWILWISIE